MPKSIRGFTLIELMVAISILAILAVAGLTVFSNTQKNARDARRKQDLDAIKNALESKKTPGTVIYTGLTGADFAGGTVPTDPKSPTQVYCLFGDTANPPTPPPAAPTASDITWTTCASAAYNHNNQVIAATTPTTSPTSWTICAKLESTGAVECRFSN